MQLLLDTHTLLWCFNDSPSLSARASRYITDRANELLVSAASAWDISTKVRLGKLPSGEGLVTHFVSYLAELDCQPLHISLEHAARAGTLAGAHGDPFDRMLIAQAQLEGLKIVSNDRIFDDYGVERIW